MNRDAIEELIYDNPILVKHARARLRRQSLFSGLAVVGALELLIIAWGVVSRSFGDPSVFAMAFLLQGVILIVLGSVQVASAVGKVRESNILDFHRISPLRPFTIAFGFFLGPAILEYVLFAAVLPLTLAAGQASPLGIGVAIHSTIATILLAWNFHALALLSSLMAKKPKANIGGVIGLLSVLFIYSGPMMFFGSRFFEDSPTIEFFQIQLPWLLVIAANLATPLVFLLIASTRKMRSERVHTLSKPQALAFVGSAGFLMVGQSWGQSHPTSWLVVLYLLGLVAVLAAMAITPDAGEYARGVRRAGRLGRARLSFWHDLALNRIVLGGIGLIVLAAVSISASSAIQMPFGPLPVNRSPSLSIAVGVLTVAYFGLAYQFFALITPKRPGAILTLFLFFAWGLPILAALVASNASSSDETIASIYALSPPAGIVMSAGVLPRNIGETPFIAAVLPAIVFFFLFNNLVARGRRKVEREVHAIGWGSAKPAPNPKEADPFAVV